MSLVDRTIHQKRGHDADMLSWRAYDAPAGCQARGRFSVPLARTGRPRDALKYACAALAGFESFGEAPAARIKKTQRLLEEIEKALRLQG